MDFKKAAKRLPKSIEKLSIQCLRYCVRALEQNDEYTALRYFHLAPAITPAITKDNVYNTIAKYWNGNAKVKKKIVESLSSKRNLKERNKSYEIPPGSIPIKT